MLSGLIVDGELHLYSTAQLTGIFLSSMVCIIGIQVLVMKKNTVQFSVSEPAELETLDESSRPSRTEQELRIEKVIQLFTNSTQEGNILLSTSESE